MSAECASVPNLENCSVILLDVAGTTTSINFVKDTLFPFVLKECEEYLKTHWEEESVKNLIKDLKEGDAELDLAAATEIVKTQTEKSSYNKVLKAIQGLIYDKGYKDNQLKGHVFSDVSANLEVWAKTKRVAIYSTGSVESQKLLFQNTTEGDLSSHISKYFDQSVGSKTDGSSYEKIAKELEVEPKQIVFITDNSEEAKSAKSVGLQSILVSREGNSPFSDEIIKEFFVIKSFDEVSFENPSKRKNEDSQLPEQAPPSKIAKTDAVEEKKLEEKMEIDQVEKIEKPEESKPEVVTKNKTVTKETEPEKKSDEEPKVDLESNKTDSDEKIAAAPIDGADKKIEEKTEVVETKATNEAVEKNEKLDEKVEGVSQENGVEPAEDVPKKIEEKENKSVLANGVENGTKDIESESGKNVEEQGAGDAAENASSVEPEAKSDETDKLKKLEESSESTAVSVTV